MMPEQSHSTLSKEEQALFQLLHEERKHDAQTFNKPAYKGIWTGMIDKYKEKAHFVYELLQNADDAQATNATFTLEKDRLIFRHNGKVRFSVSREDDTKNKGHINAITGVGNSTKNEVQGNTIGKFGVGFKAVFQYTKVPHIYDDKFWFKIENYIIPTALESDFPGRKAGETVFEFPFFAPNDAYQEITSRLRTLDNPILFLRNLKNVVINTPEKKGIEYSKKVLERKTHNSITHELLLVRNYEDTVKIHMFTKQVTINNEGKDYIQYISVGYFLASNGCIDVSQNRKVFCFFPTAENFNLKCVVHAPFLLVDSRQQLKESDAINTRLKSLLAKLAADAIVILRDYGIDHKQLLIDENIFNIIPQNAYSWQKEVFRDSYLSVLMNNDLLLARGGKYISAEQALISRPMSMLNILTDKQLSDLKNDVEETDEDMVKYAFLREETQRIYSQEYVQNILEELGIDVYKGENLARDITSEFMKANGIAWAKRLYAHLRNEQVGLWKRPENSKKDISATPFCLSPIILTTDGTWKAPYRKSGVLDVYLPLASAAEGYTFISSEYLKDKECLSFFHDLGIKEPNAWDYINSVVLKKYNEDGKISQDSIISDFEIIYDYLRKCKTEKERLEVIGALKNKIKLACLDNYLRFANEVYEDNYLLMKYFNNAKHKFINTKFYQSFIDKYSIQEFNSLVRQLGIATTPKLLKIHKSWLSFDEKKRFGIQNYTYADFDDLQIDGFDAWMPKTTEESSILWLWLSEIYSNKNNRIVTCCYQYYRFYHIEVEPEYLRQVKDRNWIVLPDGKKVKPSAISLEFLEDNDFLLDYELIKLFGIEKETKSLKELGVSDRIIEQNERGKLAEKYGLNTEQDFAEAIAAWNEKKERERAKNERKESHPEEKQEEDSTPMNPKMRKTSLDDMSSSTKEYSAGTAKVSRSTDERVQEITQKLADEANKKIEEENKRAQVGDLAKYSKIWFENLLELEYNSSITETDYSRGQIKITFEKIEKESGSSHIYVLSNPSRYIPIWIEEIGGLTVKFSFLNKDDLSVTFDVANVKDFTLRLKAKAGDIKALNKIDWTRCTRATVDVNNPVELMGSLKSAFSALDYEPDYNFCDNLSNNISFVFGPPGTGKTTRLAEIISAKMEREKCRILVLTPTNKACDVLTSKLIECNEDISWLGRFVATGDERIESLGIVVDRDSNICERDKCCIVSTMARLPYDGFTQGQTEPGLLKDIEWDFVIIDEASMIPLVQIVYAIYKMPDTNFIIAGDPHQISPIVKEKAWVGENIYTMVRLDNFENPTTIPIQFDIEKLGTQYRSIPAIGTLYSKYAYDGKLEHNRKESELKELPFGKLKVKPITFMPFRVERFDSIFGAKKLNSSNVHIYSAIFAVETCAYIAKQQNEDVKIGVICPYAPQAQIINKMLEQRTDIPGNVNISCGTIHGFQGDECDIIIAVLNPPTGMRAATDRIMLNNKNVLNVAISRASDYLFILLPHPDSHGYENLIEINKLCKIANAIKSQTAVINCDDVEKIVFDKRDYIESNTFVTTHQMANVYSKAASLYEVRIDDNSVDIQLGGSLYSGNPTDNGLPAKGHESMPENLSKPKTDDSGARPNSETMPEETSSSQTSADKIRAVMKKIKHGDSTTAVLHNLLVDKSPESIFIALHLVGNTVLRVKYGIVSITGLEINQSFYGISKSTFDHLISTWLHGALQNRKCPFKNMTHRPISSLTLDEFQDIFKKYKNNLDK